jgi:hypothetical protein
VFAGSAGYSLVFLYAASEGYRYYIVGLRNFDQQNKPSKDAIESAKEYLSTRKEKIHVCIYSKALSSLALALGGLLMSGAIFIIVSKS